MTFLSVDITRTFLVVDVTLVSRPPQTETIGTSFVSAFVDHRDTGDVLWLSALNEDRCKKQCGTGWHENANSWLPPCPTFTAASMSCTRFVFAITREHCQWYLFHPFESKLKLRIYRTLLKLSYVLGVRTGVLAISSTDLKVYQSIMALPTVHTCNTEVARVYTPPPPGGLPPHKYANPCVTALMYCCSQRPPRQT